MAKYDTNENNLTGITEFKTAIIIYINFIDRLILET